MEDSTNFRSDSTNSESWDDLVDAIAEKFDEVEPGATTCASCCFGGAKQHYVTAFADHLWHRFVREVFDAKIAASLQAAREREAAAQGFTAILGG